VRFDDIDDLFAESYLIDRSGVSPILLERTLFGLARLSHFDAVLGVVKDARGLAPLQAAVLRILDDACARRLAVVAFAIRRGA
jgi:hypothetical protein